MCTDWRREKKNWYEASGSWNEFVKHASEINFVFFWSFIDFIVQGLVADLGERPGEGDPCPSIFWVKKEEMTEGRKAGRASKIEPGPLLSSKSRSATEVKVHWFSLSVGSVGSGGTCFDELLIHPCKGLHTLDKTIDDVEWKTKDSKSDRWTRFALCNKLLACKVEQAILPNGVKVMNISNGTVTLQPSAKIMTDGITELKCLVHYSDSTINTPMSVVKIHYSNFTLCKFSCPSCFSHMYALLVRRFDANMAKFSTNSLASSRRDKSDLRWTFFGTILKVFKVETMEIWGRFVD